METRKMTEIAVLLAVAAALEALTTVIPFLHMPQGGSASLGMLPIFIIAYRHGVKEGLLAGFIFGIINFMLGGFWIHWASIIFDYTMAFTVLGFAGLLGRDAMTDNKRFALGILFAGGLRYVVHSFAGVIFWSEYAGDLNPWFYSFIVYNLPYMAASIALCLVVGLLIKDRVPYFRQT